MAFKKFLTSVGFLLLAARNVLSLDPTDSITMSGNNARSGHQSTHNMDPNVLKSGTFDQIWRVRGLGRYNGLQEEFYAQPLVFTPEGEKQSVYVVSQQNWVYRLDAVTGEILASRQLMIPFLTVPDLEGCNDIAGSVGSTATGVIDPKRNAWYLTTKTYANQNNNSPQGLGAGRYFIHAIDVITLEEKPNFPVPLEGLAADNAPWRIFEGGKHHQRPALMQINDYIYAGFASHCVQWNFTGWIMGWHAGDGRIVAKYAMEGGREANGKGGGVWMSGGGLASDNPGRMFFSTGNGYASQLADDPVPGRQPPTALEEAVVNMAIASDGSLTPTDFFIPWEKRDLDGMDKDLGTSGFILMEPDVFRTSSVQRIGCVAGKTGKLYFLNVDNLGGYQMGLNRKDDVLQTVQMAAPVFASAGTYPFEGGYVYVTPVGSETVAFKFGVTADGKPIFTEAGKTLQKSAGRQGVGHTAVTTLNGEPGTGILWISDVDGNNLRAYGTVPENGILPTLLLLNNPGQTKFSRPTFGNGRVYLTTQTGYITAFGSPVNMPLNCSSPYDLGSSQLNTPVTTKITCRAVTAVRLDSVDIDGPTHFEISGLPTFPLTLALNDVVTFNATFNPKNVGPLSTNINIRSTNLGTGKFASNTPVIVRGTGVSIAPVLSIQPNVISFGEVVTGDEAQTQVFSFRNGGQTPMVIQSYQWSIVGTSGPYITPDASVPFTLTDLPAVGSSVPAGGQAVISVKFNPTQDGYFQLYLVVQTNGGKGNVGFFGTAGQPPRAVIEWQLTNGTWIEYQPGVPFEFDGGVFRASQRTQKMRVRNIGGTLLTTTISKPPVSGPVAAVNALGSIAEGSQIAAGKSEEALIVCAPPKGQVNMDPLELTAVWTFNNNDPLFGKQEVNFRCQGLSPQVGPLDSNGQGYFRYHGCFKDADPERQLEQQLSYSKENTNQKCMNDCSARFPQFPWIGTEYEGECWCGSKSARRKVDDTMCNYLCTGDYLQYCGGDGAYMSLFYDRRKVNPNNGTSSSSSITQPSTTVSPTSSIGTGTGDATTITTSSASASPTSSGEYEYLGCANEGLNGQRALTKDFTASSQMTTKICNDYCISKGYTLSGTEYSSECFCGNALENGSTVGGSTNCNMPCSGAPNEMCGGPGALSLWRRKAGVSSSVSVSQIPTGTISASATATPTGSSDYESLGCYSEGTSGRALTKDFSTGSGMTRATCQSYCTSKGYVLSGVEYSSECYCGNTLENGSVKALETDCNMPCAGAPNEICGGPSRLNVFRRNTASTSVTATPTTSTTATPSASGTGASSGYEYVGCANEGTSGRALTKGFLEAADMTRSKCQTYCSSLGFELSGVEYSQQCFCGNTLENGATLGSNKCTMPCGGAPSETCGGPSALDVFRNKASSATATATTTISATTSASSSPSGTGSASGYDYLGCASEGTSGRALTKGFLEATDMTRSKCQIYCSSLGYELSGVEYSQQCFCGNALENGAALGSTHCTMACAGAPSETCGGPSALDVFRKKASASGTASTSATPSPTPSTSPNGWTYLGCANEGANGRALTKAFLETSDMTRTKCQDYCITQGYELAGVEYSIQCFCGNALENGATIGGSTNCNMPCGGNGQEVCGGPSALSVFRKSANAAQGGSTTTMGASTTSTMATTTSITTSSASISSAVPVIASWTYQGCANEPTGGRALVLQYANDTMTNKMCTDFCASKGYALAGTEYARECWCGNTLRTGSTVGGSTNCKMACKGRVSEICGGSGALSLWRRDEVVVNMMMRGSASASPAASMGSSASDPASSVASLASSAASSASSSIADKPQLSTSSPAAKPSSIRPPTFTSSFLPSPTPSIINTYTPLPCHSHPAFNLSSHTNTTHMTPHLCRTFCSTLNYPLSGTHNSSSCLCGTRLPPTTPNNSTLSARCNAPCAGDENQICGGDKAVSVLRWEEGYTPSTVIEEVKVEVDGGVEKWEYKGCYKAEKSGAEELRDDEEMTVDMCVKYCAREGETLAALVGEDGCVCGSNGIGGQVKADRCESTCRGERMTVCGGEEVVGVYVRAG